MFCVEPEGKELEKSFIAKTRLWDVNAFPVDTIADGVRVIAVGERNFPQLLSYCEHSVLTVVRHYFFQSYFIILHQVIKNWKFIMKLSNSTMPYFFNFFGF